VYVPACEKVAVVASALSLANCTDPGPVTFDHTWLRVPGGLGSPSSLAVPASDAPAGSVIDWSLPAWTVGPWLATGVEAVVNVRSGEVVRLPLASADMTAK
jgi:hypothetical protein